MIDYILTMYQGDDMGAFNGDYLLIELENNTGVPVTKAIFCCGNITKVFDNPEFPLAVYLTSDESRTLNKVQKGYLACFDENGLKRTCEGYITIAAEEEKVYDKSRR